MKRLARSIGTSVGYLLIVTAVSSSLFATPAVVPEIDGGMLGSALALVAGGYLVVVSKSRRK
jgi:hypothetical protein